MDARASLGDAPIRMAVDARPFGGPHCGFTIYLTSVVEPLRRAGFAITLLTNRPFLEEYPEVRRYESRRFGSGSDIRWEHVDLPRFLAEADFDLFFTGFNRGVPARKRRRTRYILGLLDVIPFLFPRYYFLADGYLRAPRHFLQGKILSALVALARADAVITISEASARDIGRIFRRRDVVAHLIRLHDVAPPPPREPRRQFVYIGGVDPRKRIDVLLRAFARFVIDHPEHELIFIGREQAYRANFDALIGSLGLADRVRFAGYVDHDRKIEILGESLALVYPSLYEGYGLALAEGMQAGVPVIAGRGGSQAEIGGDAVRWVEPTDPEDVARAMREMLDPATRAGWIARGHERLKALTDERIETDLVAYFRQQGEIARGRAGRRERRPVGAQADPGVVEPQPGGSGGR